MAPIFSVWLVNPDRANDFEDKVLAAISRALGRRDGRSYAWQKSWRTISEGMEYENNLQETVAMVLVTHDSAVARRADRTLRLEEGALHPL